MDIKSRTIKVQCGPDLRLEIDCDGAGVPVHVDAMWLNDEHTALGLSAEMMERIAAALTVVRRSATPYSGSSYGQECCCDHGYYDALRGGYGGCPKCKPVIADVVDPEEEPSVGN